MRINGGTLSLAVLTALVLAGCGSEPAAPSSDPGAGTTAGGDGPQVVLLDAGAEPRQEIRFEPEEGSTQRTTMSMEMGMGVEMDGRSSPVQTLPVMSLGMSIHVDAVSDATARATFSYDEVDVEGDDATARQMEEGLASIVGLTGTAEFTDRGEYVDSELDIPGDLDPTVESTIKSFADQIRNMAVPFPEEAVGVGATWTVTTSAEINGIESENSYTYELVEVTDEGYVLDVGLETSADEQGMELPGMPASVTAVLQQMDGSGEGRMVVDRTLLLPSASDMDMKSKLEMTIDDGKTTSEMKQAVEMRMELRTE